MQPKLIVHGGAWNIPDEYDEAHLNGVSNAIATVYPKLEAGMSALDAVEAAVNVLEEDPTFDSGRGAFLNERGEVELDAMIMDGRTLDFGSVAALQNVLHPVSVARRLMDDTEHCMLVGEGALIFAREKGFPILSPEALLTERELAFYHKIKNQPSFKTHHPFEFREGPMDTVGAVALDKNGHIAAATSTGGTARKMVGRVGDSPICGAGAYADDQQGGASATGWGESIMKILLSKTAVDLFSKYPAMKAARESVTILANRVKGMGGVIGIDKQGNYAFAHNTPKMAFAFWDPVAGKFISRLKAKAAK